MKNTDKCYAVFGAGNFGKQTIEYVGEKIAFFIDNNAEKQKHDFYGFKVYSLKEALEQIQDKIIIIAISEQYVEEIAEQLVANGVQNYTTFKEVQIAVTKEKLEKRTDYIKIYNRAINWIKENSVKDGGIITTTKYEKSYPEVTGYFIPTLLRWGYKELALEYAKWLCSIQKEDGSWYDSFDKSPYVFDSAQILKGLLAIRNLYPEVEKHIINGCDWILSNMHEDGRLMTPVEDAWEDKKTCSELIHTYCMSPIFEAGRAYNRADYIQKADKIMKYYIENYRDKIVHFDLLSHFYAYVCEAMVDTENEELAREAMENISVFQKESGAVPAYNNVDWVCSTGLFQLSIVWFRLGDLERGNKAFEYACRLQNESGGWYGSYLSEENSEEINTYFPDAEISWAVKYFLDALYYKNLAQFETQASIFQNEINELDGRYLAVKQVICDTHQGKPLKVLDIGCGKGAYLKNLTAELPDNTYFACDMSLKVMEYFEIDSVEKKQGTLTNIPYENDTFDIVYTCEALEHAVDIESALAEMARVTKSGGRIVIIDKSVSRLGYFDIEKWEQWFDDEILMNIMKKYCSEVSVEEEISFMKEAANGLFHAWVGKVR